MNRNTWIEERIRITEERMDLLSAPSYDDNWSEIKKPHLEELTTMLKLLPKQPFVLDAACGTGKYWQILLDNGSKIIGIDNSNEMLKKASKKFPNVLIKKGQLQNITYKDKFDGIICVDAMECIVPEHWPIILKKFHQALKRSGKLYLTVELEEEKELINNLEMNKERGLPVVLGEYYLEGAYHFYPRISQVKEWFQNTELSIIEEREEEDYYHFILSK